MANSSKRRSWLWLTVIATVGFAPLLGQPIQVDDPLYLGVAKRVLETPLSPFSGRPLWSDGAWFEENANPPLWSYVLAGTTALFGWREVVFQLDQCAAFALLVAGIHAVAKRVCIRPIWWTAALAWSPFLFPGRNLMVDTLFLALWTWSLEWQFRAWTENRVRWAFRAGWLAGLALLTKYTGGLLLPVFLLGSLRYRRPVGLAALAPPLLLLVLWCVHNFALYGRTQLGANLGVGAQVGLEERLGLLTRVVGAVVWWTPLWAAVLLAAGSWSGRWAVLASAAAALFVGREEMGRVVKAATLGAASLSPDFLYHAALFMGNGLFLLLLVPWILRLPFPAERDAAARDVLLAWSAVGTTFNLFVVSDVAFGAVRHVAVAIAPLILATGGSIDSRLQKHSLLRSLAWVLLASQATLAGLLAHTDRQAALIGPLIANEFIRPYAASGEVWFAGDPALRYYAAPAGGRYWRRDPRRIPLQGVFILSAMRDRALLFDPFLPRQCLIERHKQIFSWNPFRTQGAFVNFYACNTLSLPWLFDERTGSTIDDVAVYRRVR